MGAHRIGIRTLVGLVCAVAFVPVVTAPLEAAAAPSYLVDTPTDLVSGSCPTAGTTPTCSLRAAVKAANATTGATINIPAGTFALNGGSGSDIGDLRIAKPVTIIGAGKPAGSVATTITGFNDRVLDVASTGVSVSGVILTGGNAGSNDGGAVRIAAGSVLTLGTSTVRSSTASQGGGISNSGTLNLNQSTVSGNTATKKGGGVFSAGTTYITNSTIFGNSASGGGGVASSATVQIVASNITGNTSNNSNGGGVYRVGGTFSISSSILSGNNSPTARDCYGSPTFIGVNLVQNTSGCNPSGGTLLSSDPALGPLADNGGPTLTQLPAIGSVVIDAAPTPCAVPVDQRGINRAVGAGCDLGAVEVAPLTLDLSLAATPNQVRAGVQTVPIANIPTSVLGTAYSNATGTTADTALARIALARIALARIDVKSSALARIALARIMVEDLALARIDIANTALARILISDVSVDGGWGAILAGTALANVPLQTLTLAQVLLDPIAGPRLQLLDLSKLNVNNTVLGEMPLVLFAFAGQTLASLPPDPTSTVSATDQWAALLNVSATDLAGKTPLSVALARIDVPVTSPDTAALASIALARIDILASALARIALARIDVGSAALARIALARIDIANTALARIALARIGIDSTALARIALARIALARIDIANTALARIALARIAPGTLNAIVDCTKPGLNCATATLGDAVAAGALRPSALISDLILGLKGTTDTTQIGDLFLAAYPALVADGIELGDLLLLLAGAPLSGLTLADLFPALFADNDLPWERINLEATPLQNLGSPLVAPTTFTATIVVGNVTANANVSLTLPQGFVAVPAGAFFDRNGSADPAPEALPLPAVTTAGATLTFSLSSVPPGTHLLTVQARAGVQLGKFKASATGTATAGTYTRSASGSTVVEVVKNLDGSFGALTPDSLYVGHLAQAGEKDTFTTTFSVTPEQAAAGQRATVFLSNLTADYDLTVFGPKAAPLRGSPIESYLPVDDRRLGIDPGTEAVAPDSQRDIPLDAPAGTGIVGISANRSTADERVDLGNLRAGTYTVQVTGYNGAFSDRPFTLRVRTQSLNLPACSARALGATFAVPDATVPVTLQTSNSGIDTLFVVPVNRLRQLWSSADADALMTRLNDFVAAAPGGVKAGILPVNADYTTWDTNRCSPDAANDVARQIATQIDTVHANQPALQHVVLVGDDTALPFFRVADGTTAANESTYAQSFSGNNSLVGSLARSYIQTDDPYGTARGVSVSGRELFVPDLALGRLVESKADIVKALDTFTSSNGQLDPATGSSALVTGYDFLTDGAQSIAGSLKADGFPTSGTLISETWTRQNLLDALSTAPRVMSINSHFDHNRALPADQNAAGTQTNLVTVSDLPAPTTGGVDPLAKGLFFSMGCHAGLSVSDIEVGASPDSVDWSQAFSGRGAQWIANTGFGYGDTELVAYSERLMALFAKSLDVRGGLTSGQALALAKRQYAATTQVWSPYDEKALQEVVHYGLPMYRIPSSTPPAPVVPTASAATFAAQPVGITTQPDPRTGVPSATIDLDMTNVQKVTTSSAGSYYQLDGNTLQVKDRPVEPLSVANVAIAVNDPLSAGKVAHGALITALSSKDVPNFVPYKAQPVVDQTADERVPDPVGDAIFPSTLARVNRSTDGTGNTSATLLFSAGQFRPTGPDVGEQRLFNNATVQVLYGNGDDFVPPTINVTRGALVPVYGSGTAVTSQTAGFAVDTDNTARRVLVLFKGVAEQTWRRVDLVNTGTGAAGTHWTGGAVVPSTFDTVEFFLQACDGNGNCSTSNNKASNFILLKADPNTKLNVAVAGTSVGGWYTSPPAVATITGFAVGCNVQYNLDGQGWVNYAGGGINVTGEGIHTLEARDDCGDRSLAIVPIDTKGPQVTAALAPAPAPVWNNTDVVVTVTGIDPGGSGVAAIQYQINGGATIQVAAEQAKITVTAPGTTTITYSAVDAAGNASGTSGSVTVLIDRDAPTVTGLVTSGTAGLNGWYKSIVGATITATDSGGSGVRQIDWSAAGAQASANTTVANNTGALTPFATDVNVTTDGITTLSFSATDGAGTISLPGTLTIKIDRTAPSVSCAPPSTTQWYSGNVTVLCTASDGGSELASPTLAAFTLSTAVLDKSETSSAATNSQDVYDLAGNKVTAGPFTFKVDRKAPVVLCTAPDASTWYKADVSVSCTATDGGSGQPTPASFNLTATVAAGVAATVSTGTQSVIDAVGNTTIAGPFAYKIDKALPTINITSPAANTQLSIGQVVIPAFTCGDVGSGIASCTASPATLDTSTPGTRSFSVTAVDVAGNSFVVSQTYTVGYRICLLYDPLKANPLGGTVVIKLQVCDAAGTNLSSSKIVLKAVFIDGTIAPPPNFQGNSNNGQVFRNTSNPAAYIYNLDSSQLTQLVAGSHVMNFTIDGVASPAYVAPFVLK